MENEILDHDLQVQTTTKNPRWAGFTPRLGASLVDVVVYLPLLGVNMYNIFALQNLPLLLIISFAMLVYKPYMEYRYGATFGKMALKISVVNAEFQGISIPQSIIRSLPTLVSQALSTLGTVMLMMSPGFEGSSSFLEVSAAQGEMIPPMIDYTISLFYFVSCITVAFTANKQGLHDMMARTYCVHTE
jgi:uncharacterized RDD family membrane protein YckC